MVVVSRILFLHSGCPDADNDHSSSDDGCPSSPATYPEAWTGRPKTLPYLVLHRVGFTEHPRSPGDLVRSYRTVAPLPRLTLISARTLTKVRTWRYHFCGTGLHVAATPRYGAPCPAVFGLSSGFDIQRSFNHHRPLPYYYKT